MRKAIKLTAALMLSLVLMLTVAATPASAAKIELTRRELKYFEPIPSINVSNYPSVDLYLNEAYISERAYLINETTYIPLRASSTVAGAVVTFDDVTRTATVVMSGLIMTVTDGGYIVYANGRPLISRTPAGILSDGRMYIPVRVMAKALSLSVEWLPTRAVKLSGAIKPLAGADSYYRSDEVFWLSRIINAEAEGESLLGKIAVGNVVLNRVRHADYPNTIYGVIFDRKHGVQFSPIMNGSIYKTPTYESVIAARICLEGVSVSEKILFFLEPEKSTSAWIPANRPYAFTVENHWFFN